MLFRAPIPGEPGKEFIAKQKIEHEVDLFDGMSREEFMGWFMQKFREAYAAKKPETERLKMNELYYSGIHFLDPQMNREMKVTNLCFSTVETVHPVMTEQKPRPEIVPRRQYSPDEVTAVQEYAQWLMDTTEFDLCHHINTREKLKYGWCVHLLVVDPDTGICYPKPYSVFDFYKDPYCRHEDEMEFFFLASPVPTSWLKERYPEYAELITEDNIASPAYDVLERPYFDAYSMGGEYASLDTIIASSAHLESEPDPGGARALVPATSGRMRNAGTTFLLQGFFRNRKLKAVHYSGDIAQKDPSDPSGASWMHSPTAQLYRRMEPVCESGWVCVPVTASGVVLEPHPVDPCFLGIPIEIGRDYAQAGRFYCPGELDHIIPINRSINRRYNLLNRSLEFEAVPVLLADTDTGIDIDQRAVEPGDVLKKIRGSDIRWLDFRGAQASQFEMLSLEKMDLDTVSGVHDVQQGRRPEGIEAASAIRNLQDAAQTRIRGKEGPAFIEYSRLLKKMLVATGKKAKASIHFKATDGTMKSVDPAWLCYDYDIRFAQGTGSVLGRAANEEKYLQLFGSGLIDQQTALEKLGVTNIPTILQRMQALQAQQAMMSQGQVVK